LQDTHSRCLTISGLARGAHKQANPDIESESPACCRHRADDRESVLLFLNCTRVHFAKIVMSFPQDMGTDTLSFHADTPILSGTSRDMVPKLPQQTQAPPARSSAGRHTSLLDSSLWRSNECNEEDSQIIVYTHDRLTSIHRLDACDRDGSVVCY